MDRDGSPAGRRRLLGGALAAVAAAGLASTLGAGRARAAAHGEVGGAPAEVVAAALDGSLGASVLAVAERQIGVPYAWGGGDRLGAGPGFCDDVGGTLDGVCLGEDTVGFDCSGLTLYCWYQATGGAVDLAHYTVAQFHKGTPVARADLLPGDLLFFSRPDAPLHHVGLFAGGTAMIHARSTGTLVARLDDVFQDPVLGPQFAGAVRPVVRAG
ncbi:hypothetical protein GCM10009665_33160 [Kitasatospora nipponensis]|uniref:NlpC/P60 domain-containing protein n=1 Tax=Kitasatospora nipponensis TaxID=258049 RepID=A0ABN1W801_9ACTN